MDTPDIGAQHTLKHATNTILIIFDSFIQYCHLLDMKYKQLFQDQHDHNISHYLDVHMATLGKLSVQTHIIVFFIVIAQLSLSIMTDNSYRIVIEMGELSLSVVSNSQKNYQKLSFKEYYSNYRISPR